MGRAVEGGGGQEGVRRGCTHWLVAMIQPHMFLRGTADEALYLSHAVVLTPPFFGWFFCTLSFIYPLLPTDH